METGRSSSNNDRGAVSHSPTRAGATIGGGGGDWKSTNVNWLSFDLTTVERLATMARRRRTPR